MENAEKKVVINICYGGFGLSHVAIMYYAQIKGIRLFTYTRKISGGVYRRATSNDNFNFFYYLAKDFGDYFAEWTPEHDKYYFNYCQIERDDPALVQVVEELGEEANGECAKLKVVSIPADVIYEISDYDGVETIHEVHRSWC